MFGRRQEILCLSLKEALLCGIAVMGILLVSPMVYLGLCIWGKANKPK